MEFDHLKSCFFLLTPRQRVEWFIVLMFSILSATMELAGVAAVIPVVSLLVDYNGSLNYKYVSEFYQYVHPPDKETFLLTVLLASSFIIMLTSFVSIMNLYLQNRYSRRIVAELSADLFKGYLKSSIDFFHKRTAADLIRSINDVSADVVHNIIINIIHLLSRVWLLTIIFLFLLATNPKCTLLIISIILLCYAIIFRLVRTYIIKNYQDNFNRHRELHHLLINSVHSIKQIKIDNLIDISTDLYRNNKKLHARQEANIEIIGAIPRHLIESIGIVSLLIVAYWIGTQDKATNVMVSQLAFFAIAAYRILPSAQHIYHGFNRVVGALSVFIRIRDEWHSVLKIEEFSRSETQLELKSIEFDNVDYIYPDTTKHILRNFSCLLNLDGVTVINGKSGTGKSTLLELLIGLRKPEKGTILLDNQDLTDIDLREWWAQISYCDQKHTLTMPTIRKNIVANDEFIPSRYQNILDICNIDEEVYDQKLQFKEATKSLSGGEQARVSIARALYKNSKIIILDEAFAALDVEASKCIFNSILNHFPDRCYIIVSHRKEEIDLVTKKIFI